MLSVRVSAGCGGAQSLTCHHASLLDEQQRCGPSRSAAPHEPASPASPFCSSRRITAASFRDASPRQAIDGSSSFLTKNYLPYPKNNNDHRIHRYYYHHDGRHCLDRRLAYQQSQQLQYSGQQQQWQHRQYNCWVEPRRETCRTWRRGKGCCIDASLHLMMRRAGGGKKTGVRHRAARAHTPARLRLFPVCSPPLEEAMKKNTGRRFYNNASSVSTAAATHGGDDEAWVTADQQSVSERLDSLNGGCGGDCWQTETRKKKEIEVDVEHVVDQKRDGNDVLGMSSSSSVVPKIVPPLHMMCMIAGVVVAAATLAASKRWVTAIAQMGAWMGSAIVGNSGWLRPGSEVGPRALLMTLSLSGGLTSAGGTGGSVGTIVQEKLRPVVQTAWAGLVAGCLHSLTGPDHLAALAPLTIGRSRGGSALLGALWGGGHGTGQMLLGALFVLFKDQLSHAMPALSRWSSSLVGLTLIAIGAVGLKEAAEMRAAVASEAGDNIEMTSMLELDDDGKNFGLATYCNGVVFGLQPDALMVILPAMALPSRASAGTFLVTFLLGTILAMSSYTACIGVVSRQLGHRMPWVTERLSVISSTIAIALGVTFVGTNLLQIRAVL